MQYTILRPGFNLTLSEFRKALRHLPSTSEAGEYCVNDDLTGLPVHRTGIGDVFLIGEGNKLGYLHLSLDYGHISVTNLSLEKCKKLCKALKAAIRPVHCHGPKAPLPDFLFDYSNEK